MSKIFRQDRVDIVDGPVWATAFWRGRETSRLKWWFIRRFGTAVAGEDRFGLPCKGYYFRGELYFDSFNYEKHGEI